ncbi:hypothetical protein [Microbacterium radiodurans]|uniref:Uncharacterized protein n=1 Tax=Microbacterium radiodurans TaxID=661398 RepID=A0A5J5IPI1_9MICO|nr:hypothetical protein [Microbacterium radiodurans]KAA9085316.1 hypothetical protein F6B42_12655 [Microbacterium radiodurans]
MGAKLHGRLIAASATVSLLGAIITIVYLFQPWRRCDGEDTSAGCAMLPADAAVMAVAALLTIVAVTVLIVSVMTRRAVPRPRR